MNRTVLEVSTSPFETAFEATQNPGHLAPVTVGVLGLGRAGWRHHVERMQRDERFRVRAVSDLEADRLEEAQTKLGCETYTSYRDLLDKSDCELISIASQSVDHAAHTIAALESGRHVVIEKPMAMTTAEADSMIRAANCAGRKLFVHQSLRYYPDVRHIQEIVGSGLLGRIFEIRIRVLTFTRRNDWQTLRKFGGGTLNNTCSHFIDAALLLLDSPVKQLFTNLQLTTDVGDADDHAKIILVGENGRLIDIEVSTSCAFEEPKWTVLGTSGTLRSDGRSSEIKYFDATQLSPLIVDERPPSRHPGPSETIAWRTESRPSVGRVTSDFYDNVYAAIRENAALDIEPGQVREVIRILEAAHSENPPA